MHFGGGKEGLNGMGATGQMSVIQFYRQTVV